MAFEPFTPNMAITACRSGAYTVSATIAKSGNLAFSAAAAREFGLKKGNLVLVYFDPQARRIALKPANGGQSHNAFSLSPAGDEKTDNVKLSIRGLCKFYKIDLSETRRYEPFTDLNTGMIVVDLKAPIATVSRKAAAK